MAVTYVHFDQDYQLYFRPVWQFCFVITGNMKAAEDLAFRTFLVLGAMKNAKENPRGFRNAKECVYGSAAELCQQYFLQKPHRKTSRKRLDRQSIPFAVSDEMLAFMRLPLDTRFTVLMKRAGFTQEIAARLLHLPRFRVNALWKKDTVMPDSEVLTPPDELQQSMLDRIYMRFSERSVGFENGVHKAKRIFDRMLPWLVLAILILFALAYWYVEKMK